eukprot:scaffold51416_cov65-Phaeocystis_antarctica.AAC.2
MTRASHTLVSASLRRAIPTQSRRRVLTSRNDARARGQWVKRVSGDTILPVGYRLFTVVLEHVARRL